MPTPPVARTSRLYGAFRTRLLGYTPTGGQQAISALLTGGVYSVEAPDNATFPFALLRLQNRRTGNGDDGALRERGTLQIIIYGRPRTDFDTIETAMDVMENALYRWNTDTLDGLLTVRTLEQRDTLPPYQSPDNREIISVRGLWNYTCWPSYRTHLAVASGAPAPA